MPSAKVLDINGNIIGIDLSDDGNVNSQIIFSAQPLVFSYTEIEKQAIFDILDNIFQNGQAEATVLQNEIVQSGQTLVIRNTNSIPGAVKGGYDASFPLGYNVAMIQNDGAVVAASQTRILLHEIVHAVFGTSDPSQSDYDAQNGDYAGETVTKTNAILTHLAGERPIFPK